jgi:phosphoserine phosphatase
MLARGVATAVSGTPGGLRSGLAMSPFSEPDTPKTLLITLSGKDRPGVTAAIFRTLSKAGVEVIDVEQIVLRRRLILGVHVSAPRDWKRMRDAVAARAAELGMAVEITRTSPEKPRSRATRADVTILGAPLKASSFAAITGRIADSGTNIDRIERLADYPVTAINLKVSGTQVDRLRTSLTADARSLGVDIAVQIDNIYRRGVRLVVMDVDSTLIQGEVIEMLAAHAGREAEVAAITELAMRGEIDFEQSLRQRVAALAGLPDSVFDDVYDAIELNPGARTLVRTLRRLGYRFALVSGGFTQITDRLAADLGIHFSRANTLEVVDGHLTGGLVGPIVDRAGKAEALLEYAARIGISADAVIAIGDGANDLDMLNAAGLGIAYNAKPVVQQSADTSVNVPYLDSILYLMGVTRDQVEAADAAAGFDTPAPPVR